MIASSKPVAAICAVRTAGSGKSQTTRRVAQLLREDGKRVAVLRHPMPYGDLTKQVVQRFERYEDLGAADCTIEEREEYEPHLAEGDLVFAGIDYAAILEAAEREADVIVWDGGDNDTPFIRPDVHIVVVDPHRPGHELRYHPGETNLRMANVCGTVNKVDSATQEGIDAVLGSIRTHNPDAQVVLADSPFHVEGDASQIAGKRVLAIEDGPTLTHGEMTFGAAVLAAKANGAAELIDPRECAVGSIAATFEEYPHVGALLPAMGYGQKQRGRPPRDDRALRSRPRPDRHADRPPQPDRLRPAGTSDHVPPAGGRCEPTLADVLGQLRPDRRARSTRVTATSLALAPLGRRWRCEASVGAPDSTSSTDKRRARRIVPSAASGVREAGSAGRERRPTRGARVTLVVAFGGNALGSGTMAEQLTALRETCAAVAPLVREGQVVVTHGNGPQVGNELLRQERAADEVPPLPLYLAVAQTQAEIGAMIETELSGAVGGRSRA